MTNSVLVINRLITSCKQARNKLRNKHFVVKRNIISFFFKRGHASPFDQWCPPFDFHGSWAWRWRSRKEEI